MKVACLIIFLLFVAVADAADRYADPSGSGSTCSSGSPCTLAVAMSGSSAGDNIILKAGTYGAQTTVPASGTSESVRTIIKRNTGATVTVQGWSGLGGASTQYITWSGCSDLADVSTCDATKFIIDGNSAVEEAFSICCSTAHHLRASYVTVKGGTRQQFFVHAGSHHNELLNSVCDASAGTTEQYDHCVYLEGSDNLIDRNEIFNAPNYGVHVYNGSDSSGASRNIISRNIIRNNHRIDTGASFSFGIILSSGNDSQAYGNIIYGSPEAGGIIAYNGSGHKIFNNTIYNNSGSSAYAIDCLAGASSITIKNNLVIGNGLNSINTPCSGVTSSNNVTSGAAGDIFVAAGSGNFSILASASTVIDQGTASIATGITRAYNGSAPDIGAFETFGAAEAEVGLVANDVIVITITDNVAQPVLPASGITGFTTTCGTISSAARSGNTEIRLTLSGAATPPCTYSYSTGTGNVTNSALIGGTLNQRLNAITTVSVTDNTAASGPTLAYVTGRFYLLQGATDTAWTALAAAATNVTLPPGAKINWRFKIANTGDTVNVAPRVRVSYDGGGYVTLTSSFVNAVKMLGTGTQLGTVMTDGSSITQDQLASTHGNVACTYNRSAVSTPTLALTTNSESECAVAIEFDTSAVAAKVYNFKVYTDAGDEIGGPMAVTIGNYQAFR